MFTFKRKKQIANVDMSRIPTHIAIIMDGNGRYAKKLGLPRTAGHSVGAKKFREIAEICKEIGVKYFTVYAFSTENWQRPEAEVQAIMSLFREYLHEACEKLQNENIHVNFLGDTSVFKGELGELIEKVKQFNNRPDALVVNIAVNYGGRDELVMAVNKAFAKKNAPITVKDIEENLYTANQPEPDLIIRPAGEYRLSNFLLWQSSYSELYFTPVLWPDFSKEDLFLAIADFQKRKRRFGGL